MIPSITPPTDNLYKFISLFGLTILLFSVYNIGITYDNSAQNKMKIETVKMNLQQMIYTQSELLVKDLEAEGTQKRFRPAMIKRMDEDLQKIDNIINSSDLTLIQTVKIKGEISKLNIALDALRLKQWGYVSFAIIGFGLMLYGFVRWHSREQKLRDKMLEIEHAIKLLEKVHYRTNKTPYRDPSSHGSEPVFNINIADAN